MPSILVSYRRDDSKWITGRIVDRLEQHFGRDHVFMDIDAIPVGGDFREHLRNTLGRCDVLLAIIGPSWLASSRTGRPRILDAADWVRIEIESALTNGIPVIPVLIDEANMPKPEQLPASLQDFAYRQAAALDTGRDFHAHMDRLIQAIADCASNLSQPRRQSVAGAQGRPPAKTLEPPTASGRVTPSRQPAEAGPRIQSAPLRPAGADIVVGPHLSSSSSLLRGGQSRWRVPDVVWIGVVIAVFLALAVFGATIYNPVTPLPPDRFKSPERFQTSDAAQKPEFNPNLPFTVVEPQFDPNLPFVVVKRDERTPGKSPGGQQKQHQQTAAVAPGVTVAQRVFLYEEDAGNPQGKHFVGSTIWRTESVLDPRLPLELAIRADVEVPERRIAATWSLRRNADANLPASHTVEIMFKVPMDFADGGVSNVPGILMKQDEQSRGTPLSGHAVKFNNGFFLIGLNSIDRERNVRLLKERVWFDIPIVYNNNRRAILSLEKGTPGERAFAKAFTAWRQ